MKKLNYLLGIFAIAGVLFSSCETTEEDNGDITVTVQAPQEEVAVGADVTFTYTVVLGENKLEDIEIRQGTATLETIDEFDNNDSHSGSFTYSVTNDDAGTTMNWAVVVTDTKGNVETANFTIDVADNAPTITSYTATLLGAQKNGDYGSFLDANTGDVYTVNGASNNQSMIDIVYFYGATNNASLAAPDDAGANEFSVFALDSWSTKNSTKFTAVLAVDFDTVLGAEDIDGFVSSTPANSKASQLSAGDVVGFETANGQKGLVKVTDITTGETGSITISVKIQL